MGYMSFWHWIIVIAVLVLVFSRKGKIVKIFTDAAKGIKAFKKGLADDTNISKDKKKSKK